MQENNTSNMDTRPLTLLTHNVTIHSVVEEKVLQTVSGEQIPSTSPKVAFISVRSGSSVEENKVEETASGRETIHLLRRSRSFCPFGPDVGENDDLTENKDLVVDRTKDLVVNRIKRDDLTKNEDMALNRTKNLVVKRTNSDDLIKNEDLVVNRIKSDDLTKNEDMALNRTKNLVVKRTKSDDLIKNEDLVVKRTKSDDLIKNEDLVVKRTKSDDMIKNEDLVVNKMKDLVVNRMMEKTPPVKTEAESSVDNQIVDHVVDLEETLRLSLMERLDRKIDDIESEYDENVPVCRICHGSSEVLHYLCDCKGTMGPVHTECLSHWLSESGRSCCEICNIRYNARRILRRPILHIFNDWLFNLVRNNQVFIILSWLMAITPIILLSSAVCVFCLKQIFLTSEHMRALHPALAFFTFTCSITLVVWYYDMLFMISKAYFQNWKVFYIRDHDIEIIIPQSPGISNNIGVAVI